MKPIVLKRSMGIRFGTPQNRENELKTVSGIQKIAEMGVMSILILDDSKIKTRVLVWLGLGTRESKWALIFPELMFTAIGPKN